MPLNVHFNPIDIQIRKLESIKIGSRTLASYTYTDDRNNYLSSLDYGNGDKVQYSYDKYGRLVAELYEDGDTVTYKYDNSGGLASVYDSAAGITTKYFYDFTDRLMKYTETGTDFDHSVAYTYDNLNNMTGLKETINGSMLTTNYTYDDDNRVTKVENSNNNARTYTYDGFGRLAQRTTRYGDTAVLTEDFTFSQTNIESQKYSFGLRSVTQYYEYDDNGNIVTFSEAAGLERGEEGFCTTYVYDSQNQLIRENNVDAQKTWVWTYDNAGNITSRSEYAYTFGELGEPLDTVVYSYTNADWGDLLTSYDGKPITYDQIGNPLRIGSCRYSWEHGRQLASMFDGQNTAWHFTYDASGMRTSRSNGTTTYSYVYNGSLLMKMTVSNVVLEFAYDAFGAPMTITLNGSRYYYLTNVQGDVVSIVDADGVLLVHYVYDAWGNLLSTEGTMANTLGMINPLRYRGYVYDRETELYYLQSRYYNPEIGRFLNADVYASTGQGILGNNMFAYCGNNPVTRLDITGCFWRKFDWEGVKDGWNDFWGGVKDVFIQKKEEAAEAEDGTTTIGANASAAAGAAVGTSIGYTKDNKGNIGVTVSISGGGGFPSAGITGFHSKNNAPNIYAQEGWGMQIGGSVGEGLVLGAVYNLLVDSEAGKMYHGRTYNIGAGANIPVPGEIHAEINYTWVFGFNVYDFWIGVTNLLIVDD